MAARRGCWCEETARSSGGGHYTCTALRVFPTFASLKYMHPFRKGASQGASLRSRPNDTPKTMAYWKVAACTVSYIVTCGVRRIQRVAFTVHGIFPTVDPCKRAPFRQKECEVPV